MLGEIVLLQIENIGKIKSASLTLNKKGELIKLAGPNDAGKSTFLESLRLAFDSAKTMNKGMITNGADHGKITVNTSAGYSIKRTIRMVDGEQVSSLEVSINGAKLAGGAVAFLKQFSAAFQDPEAISRMGNADIFNLLSKYSGINIDEEQAKVKAAKEEINTSRKMIKNLGERTAPPVLAGEEIIDIEQASKEYEAAASIYNDSLVRFNSAQVSLKNIGEKKVSVQKTISDIDADIAALLKRKEEQQAIMTDLMTREEKGKEWIKANPAISDIPMIGAKARLDTALKQQQFLGQIKEYESWMTQREKLEASLKQQLTDHATLEKTFKDQLAAAKFPDRGFTIENGDVMLNGALWLNASTSEKLLAATKICAASIPENGARFLYISRGESIGLERQAILAKFAQENNVQIFMEIMSDNPGDVPDAIIIEEGEIKSTMPEAAPVQVQKIEEPAPWSRPAVDELF